MPADPIPIEAFQAAVGRRLLWWSALSVVAGGAALLLRRGGFLRDIGVQAVA